MPATAPDVHLARPHRPVLVTGTLDELTGPEHGPVVLPLRLWWNPRREFDLDDADSLRWMYENVLREAVRIEELRDFLHGRTLVAVWPMLNLPRGVRAAWEARHPRLRLASATATTPPAAPHHPTGQAAPDRPAG